MPQDKNMLRMWRYKWPGQKSWNILLEDSTRQIQDLQFFDLSEEDRASGEGTVRQIVREREEDKHGPGEAFEEGDGRFEPPSNAEAVPEGT
jgi:hypothetical protein